MIQPRYRTNYEGEFVVLGTVFRDRKKIQQREYIANPIVNQHISGRAAIIGAGASARTDVIRLLPRHRGGLLGQKRLQTYGADGVWRVMRLDFCVENNTNELQDMIAEKYTENTVVYTRVKNCLAIPGEFFIIPYGVRLDPIAQAAYLAAFDGHQEIFLLGVDGMNTAQSPDPQRISDLNQVFQAYSNTQFRLITDGAKPHEAWLNNYNVETWNYQKFVSHCDV
jgi:hypothetical protein